MNQFYRILLTVFTTTLLSACNKEECNHSCCGETFDPPPKFKIKELGIRTIFADSEKRVDTTQFYEEDRVAISIFIKEKEKSPTQKTLQASLFPRFLACSPPSPEIVPKVDFLRVIAEEDFYSRSLDSVKAGTNISSYFTIPDFFPSRGFSPYSEEIRFKVERYIGDATRIPYKVIIHLKDSTSYEFPSQILKVK